MASIRKGRVTFRIEDGRTLSMTAGVPQLRHIDRAWASTVHAFQGRTVDTVIAAMEANHPDLTNQKTLYVEISRARDRAELVTDDAKALRERLEAATGERIAALEAIGAGKVESRETEKQGDATQAMERRTPVMEKTRSDRGWSCRKPQGSCPQNRRTGRIKKTAPRHERHVLVFPAALRRGALRRMRTLLAWFFSTSVTGLRQP